jgi:hypothetical protein
MPKKPVFRDGKVHVKAAKCSDCVFRAGNLMHLNEGRLADLVEVNRKRDTAFACHQTTYGQDPVGEAVCRGYFDAYATEITPLRMAVALDLIEEQA